MSFINHRRRHVVFSCFLVITTSPVRRGLLLFAEMIRKVL